MKRASMAEVEKLLDKSGVRWWRGSKLPGVQLICSGLAQTDALLGGGVARGRITYLYGPEGTGKTTLALRFAAHAARVLWFDLERSWNFEWAARHAPRCSEWAVVEPGAVDKRDRPAELLAELATETVRTAAVDLVVIDSLAALTSGRVFERDWDVTLTGIDAAFNNRLVRVLNSVNPGSVAVLVIGQYRAGFGDPTYIPGGYGIRHLATVIGELSATRLRLQDAELPAEHLGVEPKDTVGVRSFVRLRKNKLGRLARWEEHLYADGRWDEAGSLLRLGLRAGTVVRAGVWYQVGEQRVQGTKRVRELLAEPKVYVQLLEASLEALAAGGARPGGVDGGEGPWIGGGVHEG